MEKSSKLVAPRKLHGTQAFYVCGAETPEGSSVGVVKNLALSCLITSYSDIEPIKNIVKNFKHVIDICEISTSKLFKSTKILINGSWHFSTFKPKLLYDKLIDLRRNGIIHIYTGIVWKIMNFQIEIYTDAGRCTRPLYIIKNNNFMIDNNVLEKIETIPWNNLLIGGLNNQKNSVVKNGIIEYIDVQEQDNCMVAINNIKVKNNNYFFRR